MLRWIAVMHTQGSEKRFPTPFLLHARTLRRPVWGRFRIPFLVVSQEARGSFMVEAEFLKMDEANGAVIMHGLAVT